MISHQKQFLFVHTPKTGGNSLQNILKSYSENRIVVKAAHQDGVERFEVADDADSRLHKHSTLDDYLLVYGEQLYDYFKFSTLRNPFDRLVSFYFSPHRGVTRFDPEQFEALIRDIPPLEHYVDSKNTNVTIDHFLRFEALEDDFEGLCQRLGLGRAALPHRNASVRLPYRDCYRRETIRLVNEKHAFEIWSGGYSF